MIEALTHTAADNIKILQAVPLPDPSSEDFVPMYRAKANLELGVMTIQTKVDQNKMQKQGNEGLLELLARERAYYLQREQEQRALNAKVINP